MAHSIPNGSYIGHKIAQVGDSVAKVGRKYQKFCHLRQHEILPSRIFLDPDYCKDLD